MVEEIINLLTRQIEELQMLKDKYIAEQHRAEFAGNSFTIITLKQREERKTNE